MLELFHVFALKDEERQQLLALSLQYLIFVKSAIFCFQNSTKSVLLRIDILYGRPRGFDLEN